MGIEVRWDDSERTLIRIDLLGRWTWDEFYTALDGIKPMVMSVSSTVHMIAVLENPFHVPANPLFHINNFLRSAPANLGVTYIVGANKYAEPFLPIASRFYPHIVDKVQFAATTDVAKMLLKQL